MDAINQLLNNALEATTGDAITNIMARVSGIANEQLKNVNSQVRVNAHHITRVAKEMATFPKTRQGRLYIRKHWRDAIANWVKQNSHLSADVLEERRRAIVAELRSQLMDDSLTSIENPVEEIDMQVCRWVRQASIDSYIDLSPLNDFSSRGRG